MLLFGLPQFGSLHALPCVCYVKLCCQRKCDYAIAATPLTTRL